jgi:hypothetical protein
MSSIEFRNIGRFTYYIKNNEYSTCIIISSNQNQKNLFIFENKFGFPKIDQKVIYDHFRFKEINHIELFKLLEQNVLKSESLKEVILYLNNKSNELSKI